MERAAARQQSIKPGRDRCSGTLHVAQYRKWKINFYFINFNCSVLYTFFCFEETKTFIFFNTEFDLLILIGAVLLFSTACYCPLFPWVILQIGGLALKK